MRERMARTALTMLSTCMSICGRSGSPPRTQRMHVAPKICDALSPRATCSSARSCELTSGSSDEPNGALQLDPEPVGVLRIWRIAARRSVAAGSEIIAHVSLMELR
jgi:hypothetical protein